MSTQPIKYNPAFLTDQELSAAFVVRNEDMQRVLNVVQDNISGPNRHVLLIGQRGIGKTMLTQRIALEVRQDKNLSKRWHPIVFAEESYEISSAGEFWLEAIFHLSIQTDDSLWAQTYQELREERNEERLEKRAIAQLMDFADKQKKKLLLVVENLDMILNTQINEAAAQKLLATLANEPRLMLLATSTTELNRSKVASYAFAEMLENHPLLPLSDADSQAVWKSNSGHDIGPRRIRALSILTGANPRLLTIISRFGAEFSFTDLMIDLTTLVDDHTDYFKSHLEALPPTERKVYVALADQWDPALTRDIATACRFDVSKTSSLIKRLVNRGAVVEVLADAKGKKRYRATERMYNIYYLMRRRGAPSERVRAAIHFMAQFYEETAPIEPLLRLSDDCTASGYTLEGILKPAPSDLKPETIQCSPESFLHENNRPESFPELIAESAVRKRGKVITSHDEIDLLFRILSREKDHNPSAMIAHIQEVIPTLKSQPIKTYITGRMNELMSNFNVAEDLYEQAVQSEELAGLAWESLGHLWADKMGKFTEAANAYNQAISRCPDSIWLRAKLAEILHDQLHAYDEAAVAYRAVLEIDTEDAWAWSHYGQLLHENAHDAEKAENAYREALTIDPELGWAWQQLGRLLHNQSARHGDAEAAYDKAIQLSRKDAYPRSLRALLLFKQPERRAEAIISVHDLIDGPNHIHASLQALAEMGHVAGMLPITKQLLNYTTFAESNIRDLVSLFSELVAGGQLEAAIPILESSRCVATLEPILAALRMRAGQDVAIATEIEQIAFDVLKEFEKIDRPS